MAVVALAGCPGSPGTTTTMLALQAAWPLPTGRTLIAAECDPDGGTVLSGALQGRLGTGYGLGNLTIPGRRGAQDLHTAFWSELVALEDEQNTQPRPGRAVLPGFANPLSEAPGFAPVWGLLADQFAGIESHQHDILVDLGRSGAFGPSAVLARRADAVVLIARTTLPSLQAAAVRLEGLREQVRHLGLVLIEEEHPATHALAELRKQRGLQVPLVGTLPYAPKQARFFSHGAAPERRFERSRLMLAARLLAEALVQQMAERRIQHSRRLEQVTGRGSVNHAG
ncbi:MULTISPECIES: hypothetical protein [unclassified Streptomyces]|uniref:MinD/ParA family ATP-binding protein n=1 Tax=unclassified Streptomyces TaxID=2593676 RepID=UPI002DDC21CE|nr:hypothetical protein [Streptomyces sp. NBC_01795]WSA97745.1 hypothetical protein OIE63_40370 [Streptomyces sp. NBC_01795]WSS46738.1 hypothetical protein OG220_39850 [Streptomyces sp. NBC_01187]WSS47045.1 hypothetical protein OG220_41775 [Streptomyces sp. NBC_01187]